MKTVSIRQVMPSTDEGYSGTSLLRSPMGLSKSDLTGEVNVIPGLNVLLFALWKLIL